MPPQQQRRPQPTSQQRAPQTAVRTTTQSAPQTAVRTTTQRAPQAPARTMTQRTQQTTPQVTASTSPPRQYLPLFGVEIEIFVKVKSSVERDVKVVRGSIGSDLPTYWKNWDFSLSNRSTGAAVTAQRQRVKDALMAAIKSKFNRDVKWKVVSDASLKEADLTLPPDGAEYYWGVEIISPPTSIAKRWHDEIRDVFEAIGQHFDLWTNQATSCHVHVSTGPNTTYKYTTDQLTRVAKGTLYWEQALVKLLPHDRRDNRYAKPNYKSFATREYSEVGSKGWGPVFKKIDDNMEKYAHLRTTEDGLGQRNAFCITFAGGNLSDANIRYRSERYQSTNFLPFTKKLFTVELRRQGGVASAESAIHRILLAVTLHISARRYDFDSKESRRGHPSVDELISELHGVIKKMPETCHGTRFIHYLNECRQRYSGSPLSEKEVNVYERKLHDPRHPRDFSQHRPPTRQQTGFSGSSGGGVAPNIVNATYPGGGGDVNSYYPRYLAAEKEPPRQRVSYDSRTDANIVTVEPPPPSFYDDSRSSRSRGFRYVTPAQYQYDDTERW